MPSNQDAVKLLPCPFCGGEDIDVSIYPYSTTIQCNKCQAFSPRYGCTNQISEKAAISRWNTRAPTPREAELEAQNKALWELVGNAEKALDIAEVHLRHGRIDVWNWVKETLAAIRKAKEVKV
jgi:Lar family restriction alleviation protein